MYRTAAPPFYPSPFIVQTAEERAAFKLNTENHLQPILSFLETTLNKVACTFFSLVLLSD
jgi:hypothetical protein